MSIQQRKDAWNMTVDMREELADIFIGSSEKEHSEDMKEAMNLHKLYSQNMLKLLSSGQKKKWDAMLGKKFKFQKIEA